MEFGEHVSFSKRRGNNVILINQVIDRIVEDREITKVDHICQRYTMNKRKLQRLFDFID